MGLCKRVLARLDLEGSRLIKGIRFEGLRVLGDPFEAACKYAKEGADELLYIDAVASLYGRNSLSEVLRRTSQEVFVPILAAILNDVQANSKLEFQAMLLKQKSLATCRLCKDIPHDLDCLSDSEISL